MKGSIEVICGPMFSGKTEELIKRVKRICYTRQILMAFTHSSDNRYGEENLTTHDGKSFEAISIPDSEHLSVAIENHRAKNEGELPDVVAIEEIQFFDEQIIQVVYDLKCQGVRVIVAGLDIDWRGTPFNITATLLALADKVDKQTAVCLTCGDDATYSYLKNKNGEQIQVGAADKYEARCFKHWAE